MCLVTWLRIALILSSTSISSHQVWGLNRRVKFYFCLTVIAMVVDLAIGSGGIFTYVSQTSAEEYVSVTFSMRNLHIALDTIVLYGALGETKFVIASSSSGVRSSTRRQGDQVGGSSLRSANPRQGSRSRGGSGGPSKNSGSDCERGHRIVPPTVRAPSKGSGNSKLWPPVPASKPAIHHSSSRSTPPAYST